MPRLNCGRIMATPISIYHWVPPPDGRVPKMSDLPEMPGLPELGVSAEVPGLELREM